MLKYFSIIIYLLSGPILAQRGGNAENISEEKLKTGSTYALIVGVSDYENENIPDLQYADIDALIFQDFLLSVGVPKENVFTLINENATNASFWTMMNFLSQKMVQGDEVYIYFSGHGDVESNTIVQDAYLLPYDSPYTVYPMGAIGVTYLKSWIATFSSKGVQTIFIVDACRSGHLIGGEEGAEAAANILKDKWKDEIKIVSCQPGELSLEGKQWGGGRGLFSYELINGISGLADKNNDEEVTLRELNLYLLEKIPEEAGDRSQNPILSGNFESKISTTNRLFLTENESKSEVLSLYNNDLSSNTRNNNSSEDYLLKATQRGIDNSSINNPTMLFNAFKQELDRGKVISSDSKNAYEGFKALKKAYPEAELTDVAQLLLSKRIVGDINMFLDFILGNVKEDEFVFKPVYEMSLEATILRQINGDQKLKENGQFALTLFGEAIRSISRFGFDKSLIMPKELALMKLDTALLFDPGAVYINCLKGFIYEYEYKDKEKAISEYKNAFLANPNFYVAKEVLFNHLFDSGNFKLMIEYNKLSKQNLASTFWAYTSYSHLEIKDSSQVYFARLQSYTHTPLDPKSEFSNEVYLVEGYMRTAEYEKGMYFCDKAERSLERFKNQIDSLKYKENLNSLNYHRACAYSNLGKKDEAIQYLGLVLKNKKKDEFDWWMKDNDFDNIRNTRSFKQLIKQYGDESPE